MSLEKHQEAVLRARLDELFLTGSTFIGWPELSHWFNVERIAKKPYREIHEMWDDVCARRGFKTMSLQVRGLNQNLGGIRLVRPYDASLDGEQQSLDALI